MKIDELLNTLIIGDSKIKLRLVPDNSVDIIVTSPPYNINKEYDNYIDNISVDKYIEKLCQVWRECFRVLKSDGRIAVVIQPSYGKFIPTHHLITSQLSQIGFHWLTEIIWNKKNYSIPPSTWGSWCSPSAPFLKSTFEFVEVFFKSERKKVGKKEDIDICPFEFKRWTNLMWNVSAERQMKKYGHPAMFPEVIPERLLKLFSYRCDIVLDPFNGVGTTSLVARKLFRCFIGIDTSKRYCETALSRVREVERQTTLSGIGKDFPLTRLIE